MYPARSPLPHLFNFINLNIGVVTAQIMPIFDTPPNGIVNIFQSVLSAFGIDQTTVSCTSADDSGDLVNDRIKRPKCSSLSTISTTSAVRRATFDSENPPLLLLAITIVTSYVIVRFLERIWGPTVPPANDVDPDDHDDDSSSNSSSEIIRSTTGGGASVGLETIVQDVEI